MNTNLLNQFFLKVARHRLFIGVLVLHLLVSYYYISKQDITFDEPHYLEYAKRWLQGKPDRIYLSDDSKSPVIAVCWIPRIIQQTIHPGYKITDGGIKDQVTGRFLMILFSLITSLYVYWWCCDLYGRKGWFFPLVLLLFDPLYLAYSTIITTDLACAAFLVALLYHFRKYLLYGEQKQFYLAAIFTGIGIITKATLLFSALLLPLLVCIFYLLGNQKQRIFSRKSVMSAVVYVLVVLVVINALYYFHKSFAPLSQFTFVSSTFRNFQQSLTFFHWLPVPLPSPFIQSLDMLQAQAEMGAGTKQSTYNGVYLLGQLKLKGGFWYYYLVVLFYKMPIGTILLCAASIGLFIKKFCLRSFVEKYMFLLVPIAYFWIVLSFFNQFQTGLRHLLVVFPLLFIGLGRLFKQMRQEKAVFKVMAGLCVAYTFVSVAIFYPYLIPYTNEVITDKKTVYKKILDSGIDYNQVHLNKNVIQTNYLGYKMPSPVPDTGRYALTMNQLYDKENWENGPYNWYRTIAPTQLDKYVVLLYDIKPEDLAKARLKPGIVNKSVEGVNKIH